MNDMPTAMGMGPLRVVMRHLLRFMGLTAAMSLIIGLLVLVEGLVLWRLGVDYLPKMAIRSAGVYEFALDETGRWAASRIVCVRESGEEMLVNEVLLHDMRRAGEPICLEAAGFPRRVVIATDATCVAIACYDGSIYIRRDVPGAEMAALLAKLPTGEACEIACTQDGRLVAAADCDHIYLWRVGDGKLLYRKTHPGGAIRSISFSKDSSRLLTADIRGTICLWDVPSGELQRTFHIGERLDQTSLSADGRSVTLITSGGNATRRILDVQTGKESVLASTIPRRPHAPIAFSRDGALAATVGRQGHSRYSICFWDAKSGLQLGELPGSVGYVHGLAFAADGTLYSWDSKGVIIRWDISKRRQTWKFCALEWARREPALQTSKWIWE